MDRKPVNLISGACVDEDHTACSRYVVTRVRTLRRCQCGCHAAWLTAADRRRLTSWAAATQATSSDLVATASQPVPRAS